MRPMNQKKSNTKPCLNPKLFLFCICSCAASCGWKKMIQPHGLGLNICIVFQCFLAPFKQHYLNNFILPLTRITISTFSLSGQLLNISFHIYSSADAPTVCFTRVLEAILQIPVVISIYLPCTHICNVFFVFIHNFLKHTPLLDTKSNTLLK